MSDTVRNRRVRNLVRRANAQRKKQAAQIDILCNDFVAAQKQFVGSLHSLSFTADFYESILSANELEDVFRIAAEQLREHLDEPNVAIFLRNRDNFELLTFRSEGEGLPGAFPLESCFNAEVVNEVCMSNNICWLESLLSMGLGVGPKTAEKLCAVAIPLGTGGASTGFVLLYRPSDKPITAEQVNYVSGITSGLSAAIGARRLSSTPTL